jgi:hypothetical protein
MKSAYRKFAAGDCQPDTVHDRHSVYGSISNGVYEQEYPGTWRIPRRNLETLIEYLPRPRQLGEFPQTPSEGVPPPASPLLRPPTTSSAKLLSSYPGADTVNHMSLGGKY